jgi:UDP-3-O-[3-hydroxymyristoyl] N-acetylglucosamine deacetylase
LEAVGDIQNGARIMGFKGFTTRQSTVDREIVIKGIGVHSGAQVSLIIHPAEANSGYNFYLQGGSRLTHIPGDFRAVSDVMLCTVLSSKGASVATVEHLLAALRGLGVDNADIEIDGQEVPIMDGSAEPFVDAIEEAGLRDLEEPRRYIKVRRPVQVKHGESVAEIFPYNGFRVDVEIDFKTPLIGRQRLDLEVTPSAFKSKLSRARTFGFMKDVKQLWAAGRALGASLENTVALADDRILNPEGLRYPNEFVRHKALDAVGDLALAGAPLLGYYRSYRGGHHLNSAMLHALYANRDAWTIVEMGEAPRHTHDVALPADLGIGFASPNFAPETA